MHDDFNTIEGLRAKRDQKAMSHLEQYAPVWIVDEHILLEDEAIQFNVVFQHNTHGWVSRRYRYDGFNNVLYHKGQTLVHEDALSDIMEKEPYITSISANIPNAYGG